MNRLLLFLHKVARKARRHATRFLDARRSTHAADAAAFGAPLIPLDRLDVSGIPPEVAGRLADLHLAHRFDLLGSGWRSAAYDAVADGFGGHRYGMNVAIRDFDRAGDWLGALLRPVHLPAARAAWRLVSPGYRPVDWQRDAMSGYRWSERTWYMDIPVGGPPGADIKAPWEFSRLQHLPRLALFAVALPARAAELAREFQDQALDFIAVNPPRMGVNWVCTMDVAIRAANLVVAHDLFRQVAAPTGGLPAPFEALLARSILDHGRHIARNLEWDGGVTSNHFLSNVAGLAFAAAGLAPTPETDDWLAWCYRALPAEIATQFLEDGGNFEASTAYHRLSGEMVVHAVALLAGLFAGRRAAAMARPRGRHWPMGLISLGEGPGREAFPTACVERLRRIGAFAAAVMKPDGRLPQVGDNDSGRFFRFTPSGELLSPAAARDRYRHPDLAHFEGDAYWDEDELDLRPFLAGWSALFPGSRDARADARFAAERSLVSALARGITLRGDGRRPLPRPP